MIEHIDDILASDLLERYVLGDVSDQEKMKVDLLRVDHKVIRDRLNELELTMEKAATENAIEAPPAVRECIIKSLHGNKSTAAQNLSQTGRVYSGWWKLAAACIIGGLAMWMFMQNSLNSLQTELSEEKAQLTLLQQECNELSQQYAFLNESGTVPFLLAGTALATGSQVVVYWNEDRQKSMLRVIDLPAIRSDQTYQLWADVDGEMRSLGIFEAGEAVANAVPMNYLANATSLNITVEPAGGSEHPTVSTLTASILI